MCMWESINNYEASVLLFIIVLVYKMFWNLDLEPREFQVNNSNILNILMKTKTIMTKEDNILI